MNRQTDIAPSIVPVLEDEQVEELEQNIQNLFFNALFGSFLHQTTITEVASNAINQETETTAEEKKAALEHLKLSGQLFHLTMEAGNVKLVHMNQLSLSFMMFLTSPFVFTYMASIVRKSIAQHCGHVSDASVSLATKSILLELRKHWELAAKSDFRFPEPEPTKNSTN